MAFKAWGVMGYQGPIPNTAIINVYGRGTVIPAHIDHKAYARPFYSVTFNLEEGTGAEAKLCIGSKAQVSKKKGPTIALEDLSMLVFTDVAADKAYHRVMPVPGDRISITFRFLPGLMEPIPDEIELPRSKHLGGQLEGEDTEMTSYTGVVPNGVTQQLTQQQLQAPILKGVYTTGSAVTGQMTRVMESDWGSTCAVLGGQWSSSHLDQS